VPPGGQTHAAPQALAEPCPRCGTPFPPQARFCGDCGQARPEAPKPPRPLPSDEGPTRIRISPVRLTVSLSEVTGVGATLGKTEGSGPAAPPVLQPTPPTPGALPPRATHPWAAHASQSVRFGLAYGPRSEWLECRDLVQEAEALGFDSYWTMDHPTSGMDCWTLLSALAISTRTIRLGVAVNCIFYRPPTLLARLAADVDRLSGGRLLLGLGIGNHQQEFAKLGLPFLPVRERQQVLIETLQIIEGLWGSVPFTYHGQHFQVKEANVRPGPVQQPHIPIMLAGGGERGTLRHVAQYADMANFGADKRVGEAITVADIVQKYAVLHQHCATLGRDYDGIVRSFVATPVLVAETRARLVAKLAAIPAHIRWGYASGTVVGLPEEIYTYYQRLMQAGVRYFLVGLFGQDLETVRLLAKEVVPQLTAGAAC
jgi:alkanesulfonate monooxygenase SsuD/methylene tetrahydromethanopterin reductase-like flavin-dependent oxidoreductase (luciferase family)